MDANAIKALIMWTFGGLAVVLTIANLSTFFNNLRGRRYRSAIFLAPSICALIAFQVGAPWWFLAVLLPLDLALPFVRPALGRLLGLPPPPVEPRPDDRR